MEISVTEIAIWVSLLLFMLGHLITGVAWASRISEKLVNITTVMKELSDSIRTHDANIYTKTEASSDFTKRDMKIDAMFEQVDINRNDITELRTLVKK